MGRTIVQSHESEDPAAVVFREEAEAVPMESEVFCRSDGRSHNSHQNEKVHHYNLYCAIYGNCHLFCLEVFFLF